jgi:hypothetical protein
MLCCTAFDLANNISHYQKPSSVWRYSIERVAGNKEALFDDWDGNRLQSYLTFKDWTHFDCAMTNRALRRVYKSYIIHMPVGFPRNLIKFETAWACETFTRWILSRELRLVSIVLSPSIVCQLQIQRLSLPFILRAAVNTPLKENAHHISGLLAKMKDITHLDLTNNQRLTTSDLKSILKQCTKINVLSLSQCKHVNDSTIKKIELYGQSIQKLDISKCRITPKALLSMLPALHNLVSLNISSCRFSLKAIADILRCRPGLEEFQMNHLEYSYVNKAAERNELDQLATSISSFGRTLIVLSLNGLKVLSDGQLLTCLSGCRKLRKLCLESCTQLTNSSIWNLGQNCPNLVSLDIRNCGNLTDEAIHSFIHHFQRCEDLAIDGCYQLSSTSIEILQFVNTNRRNLRFTYSHCPRVDAH